MPAKVLGADSSVNGLTQSWSACLFHGSFHTENVELYQSLIACNHETLLVIQRHGTIVADITVPTQKFQSERNHEANEPVRHA
jgi:hypothetical protein